MLAQNLDSSTFNTFGTERCVHMRGKPAMATGWRIYTFLTKIFIF